MRNFSKRLAVIGLVIGSLIPRYSYAMFLSELNSVGDRLKIARPFSTLTHHSQSAENLIGGSLLQDSATNILMSLRSLEFPQEIRIYIVQLLLEIIFFSHNFSIKREDSLSFTMLSDYYPLGKVLSCDGRSILIRRNDGRALVYNLETKELLVKIKESINYVISIALNFSKSILLIGDCDCISLWSMKTGKVIKRVKKHGSGGSKALFSPDGKTILSTGYDRAVRLWNAPMTKVLKKITWNKSAEDEDFISAIAFSCDGKSFLVESPDYTVVVFCLKTKKKMLHLKGHTAKIKEIVCGERGATILTSSDDRTLRLWDSVTGELNKVLSFTLRLCSVAFNHDESLIITVSGDLVARLWDVSTGCLLQSLNQPENPMYGVNFYCDENKIITQSQQGICVWDTFSSLDVNWKGKEEVAFEAFKLYYPLLTLQSKDRV